MHKSFYLFMKFSHRRTSTPFMGGSFTVLLATPTNGRLRSSDVSGSVDVPG